MQSFSQAVYQHCFAIDFQLKGGRQVNWSLLLQIALQNSRQERDLSSPLILHSVFKYTLAYN